MATLEKVRWQNLLSYGNSFTEVVLNESLMTLVMGENGAGKTTMLEALSFALFNKTFRKINRSEMINSITGKGLLVEVEFSTPQHKWLVRRGIKPNVFEVYRDGALVPAPADLRDYQEWLETGVLGMTHRTFGQVVVLSSSHVPFMELRAHERREVVESLLDIDVYSKMNSLLRDKIVAHEQALREAAEALRVVESKIELNARHLQSLRQDALALIEQRRATIEEARVELNQLATDARTKYETALEREAGREALNQTRADVARRDARLEALKTRARSLDAELRFLESSDECPTCRQGIGEEHKHRRRADIESEVADIKQQAASIASELSVLREAESSQAARLEEARLIKAEVERMGAIAREKQRFIDHLEEEVARLEKRSDVVSAGEDVTAQLEAERERVRSRLVELSEQDEVFATASALLKDGGVKAAVLRQYMPTLNALVAKYLAALDFFVEFTLDENFEATVRSRYRDNFSWDNFSAGEKCRLNLALLFAWRALARLRNSLTCNLLVADEVLDSSLDALGAEDFMKIVATLEGENVFVISHRGDQIGDKFERVLEFRKHKNFSQMIERK